MAAAHSTSATKKDGWEIFEVCFDNFERLPFERGEYVESAKFTSFGHQWCLAVYPGGEVFSGDGRVSIYLYHKSKGDIEVDSSLMIKSSIEQTHELHSMGKYHFPPAGSAADCLGEDDFDRLKIISGLKAGGTLVVDVRMSKVESTTPVSMPFVPENPLTKTILSKFNDETSSDLIFEVGDGTGTKLETRKKAKVSTTFYAHRFILKDLAPLLAPSNDNDKDEEEELPSIALQITGVKPEIFHFVLYYTYGGKISEDDMKANARDIIDASDRYGVVNLKLEAEASYVNSTTITVSNLMNQLHYAVSKNCALLQEAVMDYILENGSEVLKGVSFDEIPGGSSLFVDLIAG